MTRKESMPLGVVLERRAIDHPWEDHAWRPVAVIPGAPTVESWRRLGDGDGWVHYHAGTLDLELFPRETDGYRTNLGQPQPAVYVVLRTDEGDEEMGDGHEVAPVLVTVCPHEAEGYVESGDEIVEAVPMPEEVAAWVQAFVDEHHVEVPFVKRKRDAYDPRKDGFRTRGTGKQRT